MGPCKPALFITFSLTGVLLVGCSGTPLPSSPGTTTSTSGGTSSSGGVFTISFVPDLYATNIIATENAPSGDGTSTTGGIVAYRVSSTGSAVAASPSIAPVTGTVFTQIRGDGSDHIYCISYNKT